VLLASLNVGGEREALIIAALVWIPYGGWISVSKDLFPVGCVRSVWMAFFYVSMYGESVFCSSRQDSTSVVVSIFFFCFGVECVGSK